MPTRQPSSETPSETPQRIPQDLAINPLIKVVNMIALLFVEIIVVYGLYFVK